MECSEQRVYCARLSLARPQLSWEAEISFATTGRPGAGTREAGKRGPNDGGQSAAIRNVDFLRSFQRTLVGSPRALFLSTDIEDRECARRVMPRDAISRKAKRARARF